MAASLEPVVEQPTEHGGQFFQRVDGVGRADIAVAVEGGASDLHIKTGTPVIFRISRELIAVECDSAHGDCSR